jgi:hypothetical protein
MEAVVQGGGERFFRGPGWKKRLHTIACRHRLRWPRRGRFETTGEQREAIRSELTVSKQVIEERLRGKSVRQFSFPWSQVGTIALELLSECGYDSAYTGLLTKAVAWQGSGRPHFISRVNGDFVLRLPGKGRQSLGRILFAKAARRVLQTQRY